MWLERKYADRSGFALPTSLLVIVVLTALGLFGLGLARQELGAHVRISSRAIAFYAAETGLARGLENWSTPGVVNPGESWLLHEGTLPGGATYRVEGKLLDDAGTIHALYSIQAEGRARNGVTRRAGLLAATVPFGNPIRAALKAKGQVRVAGQAEVNGLDTIPPAWSTDCPATDQDMTGALMSDTSKVAKQGAAQIEGSPPVDEQSDTTGWFDFGDYTYEEMTTYATITLPGGTNVSGSRPAPSYLADGSCDTSDQYNWGDPEGTGTCQDWFPVIHVTGNLRAEGSGAGQGILLVDGDLEVCGGFTFYGPVVVQGRVKSCGSGFRLLGGVVTGDADLNPSGGMIVGGSQVQYSHCVVLRALSRSAASRPQTLLERPWFQVR